MKTRFQTLAPQSEQILMFNYQADLAASFQAISRDEPRSLVIIDARVSDCQRLAMGIVADAIALILDPDADGVKQVTEALQRHRISNLHLVAHGSPGCLYLGNTQLSLTTIADYAEALQQWFSRPNCTLLLYGCQVAAGDAGSEFIDRLQTLTGAAIAASSTTIGNASLGGNWQLDVTTPNADVALCFREEVMQSYEAVLAAGDLDTSFGAGGISIGSNFINGGDYGLLRGALTSSVALQSDGKLLVSRSSSVSRYNSDSSLDTSFGNNGSVATRNSGKKILIQPDGKIVVVGDAPDNHYEAYDTRSFALTRYDSNGSFDTSFGDGGSILSDPGRVFIESLQSAVLQPDGKILLAGYSSYSDRDSSIKLMRYNSNGSLDTSFGNTGLGDGTSILNPPGQSYGFSIALQADGQIVLAGTTATPGTLSPQSLALYKFDSNGSLVLSNQTQFGSYLSYSGFRTEISELIAPQLAIQPDGKIIVAEHVLDNQATYLQSSLFRFNSDLSFDNSFGNNGRTSGYFGQQGVPVAYSGIALQADGKIVVSGTRDPVGLIPYPYYSSTHISKFVLERYNSNGALDSSFGTGGGVLTDFGGFTEASATGLVIQPDGKIVAVGVADKYVDHYNSNFYTALVRYSSTSSGANLAPTDITVTGSYGTSDVTLYPANAAPTPLTNIGTVDPDLSDSHLYTLVAGPGDTDNVSFSIQGGKVLFFDSTKTPPKQTYTIRLRTDDGRGGIFEKPVRVTVPNFAPTAKSNYHIDEKAATIGSPFNFSIADFFFDPNPGDTFTVSATLSNGKPLPAWLSFNPTTQRFSGTASSNDAGGLTIQLKAIDQAGASSSIYSFYLSVMAGNLAPTSLLLSNSTIAENLPANTLVGTLAATDANPEDTFTYSLVSGVNDTDNAAFSIVGNTLRTNQSFNYEAKSSYTIRVRITDDKGGIYEFPYGLSINIQNANDTPIVVTPIADQTTTSAAFGYTVPANTFQDGDDKDVLTLSATLGDGSPLPAWLSFDPRGGRFSGVPGNSNVGTQILLVKATDRAGASVSTRFNLTITPTSNQAPTDFSLSSTSIAELPIKTIVGTFSAIDPDVGDVLTYSFVPGIGSINNAGFTIAGNVLQAKNPFDFESKQSYSIRVRTDDGKGGFVEKPFTIKVLNVNEAPFSYLIPYAPPAVVGIPFSYTPSVNTFVDPDREDVLTLSLTRSDGSALPAWLTLNSVTRTLSGTPGINDVGSLNLLLKATDIGGLSATQGLVLTINNPINQAPTDLSLSSSSVAENLASGTTVGTFATTDPNPGDTFTYSLVSGTGSTDNAAFTLVGNTLRTAQAFDFEAKSAYSIRVRTDDGKGGTFDKSLTIAIQNVNETPVVATAIANQSVATGTAFSYVVPATTFSDPDAGDALTLSATLGDGSALPTWLTFNPTTRTFSGTSGTAGTLNLLVKASDRAGLSTTTGFNLTVTSGSLNQAPTNLSLSSTSIAENLPANSIVGTLTTTDPNPGDTFTYSLVSGTGSTDNAAFTLVGNTLRTKQAFDYEAKSVYSIRVRTDDGKGGVFTKVLTIKVQDVNDAPIVVTALTSQKATVGKSFRYVLPADTFFDQEVAAENDSDELTLSATLSNGGALPSWLRFNASTGTFSGTPKSGNAGSLSVVVKATDRTGASASSSFVLSVQ